VRATQIVSVTLISRYVRYVTTMMLLAVFMMFPPQGILNVFKNSLDLRQEAVKGKFEHVQLQDFQPFAACGDLNR
jgi:hypothetical protein